MTEIPNVNAVGAFFGLLDCPFCGDEPQMIGDSDSGYSVYCAECNEGGHVEVGWFFTVTEAITAWNTRVERTCEMRADGAHCMNGVEFYECRSCGEYACIPTAMGKSEPPNYCPNCGAKVVD